MVTRNHLWDNNTIAVDGISVFSFSTSSNIHDIALKTIAFVPAFYLMSLSIINTVQFSSQPAADIYTIESTGDAAL